MTEASRIEERKVVTVLFCDLVGSTALGERLDPEALRSIQTAYFDRMQSVIEQFGGTVEKFIGDAVVAVFGVPHVHEDDAERAVRCALEMRDALRSLNDSLSPRLGVDLSVRIGIDTGEAVTAPSDHAIATGDVTNSAARVQQSALPGEILVGRQTYVLTEGVVHYQDRPPISAKGKAQPVAEWTPRGVSPAGRRRSRFPMFGRDSELQALLSILEETIASSEPRFVLVLGEPGIGKTRLAEEFAIRAGGRARVLRGAARPYGEGTAWSPLADLVKEESAIAEGDPPEVALPRLAERLGQRHTEEEATLIEAQLGPLLGAARPFGTSGQEILWAIGRYLERLSETHPVVVVLDDLHWADRILLETILKLPKTIGSGPVLLVGLGRPELAERFGDLGRQPSGHLALQPLSDRDAMALVSRLKVALGKGWPEDQEGEIVRRAGGNPLFIEEIGAIFADVGSLERPATLHALIAARIDLLPAMEKRVSQAASVVGDVFWDGAVAAALDGDQLAEAFRTLRSRGFVDEEEDTAFHGHRQLRFHHNLIREVVYESLPKSERSRMHRRVAGWLEPRTLDRPNLWVGVAHHLDRALTLETEVAVFKEPSPGLPDRTANAYLRAAEWTSSNAALPEAISMLERAVQLSSGIANLEPMCLAMLSHTRALSGDVETASREARMVVSGEGPPEAAAIASLALSQAAFNRGDSDQIRKHAQQALSLARREGMARVEARGLDLLAWAEFWGGDPGGTGEATAERYWRDATASALRAGERTLAVRATGMRAMILFWKLELEAAEAATAEALRLAADLGSLQALVVPHLDMAGVRFLQGRLNDALEYASEYHRLSMESGDRVHAIAACSHLLGPVLRLLGRVDDAWNALEVGWSIDREMGGSPFAPNLRIERALVLLSRGRVDEAEGGLELAIPADESDRWRWAAAFAETRSAQGRYEEAERLWRETLARPEPNAVDPVDVRVRFARWLVDRRRLDAARGILDEVRSRIAGKGALLFEAQVAELEAKLTRAESSGFTGT